MIMRKIYVDKARRELNREWEDWNRRRKEAESEGREFNEPSPRREGTGTKALTRYVCVAVTEGLGGTSE